MLIHGTADGKYLYTSDVIYIIHETADGKYLYTSDVIYIIHRTAYGKYLYTSDVIYTLHTHVLLGSEYILYIHVSNSLTLHSQYRL